MKLTNKMNYFSKMKKCLKIINLLTEKSFEEGNTIGILSKVTIKEVIEKQNIFENIDQEKIALFRKKYISIEEFNDDEKYYDNIYALFLNKMYKFINRNVNTIKLFKSFNQVYFYRKYIEYTSEFLERYPTTLSDDIIKEKLYEIVHSLESDDKLYYQDFYFYISMNHLIYHYKKKDIAIPEFKRIKNEFEKIKIRKFLRLIKLDKISLIEFAITSMKYVKSKNSNELQKILSNVLKDIKKNKIFQNIDDYDENDEKNNKSEFDDINWDELITDSERKLGEYLEKNEQEDDVNELYQYLEGFDNCKEKAKYYYVEKMESFLSLSKEDKYIFINSYDYDKKIYTQSSDYKSIKESYDQGMNNQVHLKENIEKIITSKEFFNLIKDILESGKVVEYISNPIQYIQDKKGIKTYNEKEGEKEILKQKIKDKNSISKFEVGKNQNNMEENEQKMPLDCILAKECEKYEDYKCQLQFDYEYFLENVFKEGFFKDRIIYSFLPYGIKAFVNYVPKIVLNVCENNIKFYNKDNNNNNSEDCTTMLKALYAVIIIHEIIHLIRRENKKEHFTNEYTPKPDNCKYEGGKSFIYHIFGDFVIIYVDLQFAKVILKKESWEKDNDELKKEFLRFKNKKDEEIINSMIVDGGIKCYDSTVEDEEDLEEDLDFCCQFAM